MLRRQILIVDDQREVRRVLRAGLETLPGELDIHEAPSGEEALLMISGQPFDLLVADIRLPGLSGLELKGRALLLNPDLKLILITGMTDPVVRRQAASAGADAFFLKPVEMPAFLDSAARCLGLAEPAGAQNQPEAGGEADLLELLKVSGAAYLAALDERYQAARQAGTWPAGLHASALQAAWASALQAAGPLRRIFQSPGSSAWQWFTGAGYGLALGCLPDGQLLAAVFTAGPGAGDLETGLERLRRAAAGRTSPGPRPDDPVGEAAPPEGPAAASPAPGEEDLAALEAAFRQGRPAANDPHAADSFWDQAAADAGPDDAPQPGSISFDQARRLGLGPEDEAE